MCRISGIINLDRNSNIDIAFWGKKMRDTLAYGGPDDAGFFSDDRVYLGHRRLSIIDISEAGHQPMFYKNFVIVFNGEIYNYKEIAVELETLGYTFESQSDTEVILKAFDCWSYSFIDRFRGMFSFAIFDTLTQKLLLCRDRVGVKPLYYYYKEGMFLFASELKSFRQFPSFDTAIDQDAVSSYLQSGYIRSPYTIYKHAHKIMPGHFLEIDKEGMIKTWAYWRVNDIKVNHEIIQNDRISIIDKAEKLITESCQLRMVSDVPVGVFLSGGIDSSLVTALLQKNRPQKIQSFTIGFENAGFDESTHAQKIANYLGTEHRQEICTENDFLSIIPKLPDMYDEPFGDSSAIPTHMVAAMARKHVTVALSADGGDEVFSGYTRYQLVKKYYQLLYKVPLPARSRIAAMMMKIPVQAWHFFLPLIRKKSMVNSLEWRLPKLANVLSASSAMDMYERGFVNIPKQLLTNLHYAEHIHIFHPSADTEDQNLLNILGKTDIRSYLEGDILTKVDRATMQVALEGREPLLDHKIIEFGLSLPDEYKIRNGETKWILKQVLSRHIPKELWDRPKQGFGIPVKKWLQEFFKEDLLAMAKDQNFHERFQLNGPLLEKMVHQFFDANSMTINPHFMWSLYMLYKWHERWA